MQKRWIISLLLFIAQFSFGQSDDVIRVYLRWIFLNKSELIDNQIFTQELLDYEYFVNDLKNKSEPEIIAQQFYTDSIVYSTKNQYGDTLMYRLHFNNKKQLVHWKVDLKDCYDRSSDVPTPNYTNTTIVYNKHGNVHQILSNCPTSEHSILTMYYYDSDNKLDSVICENKFGNYTYIDKKLIFIDSLVSSGEKGSTVLILNTPLDYKKWLDYNYNEATTINSSKLNDSSFVFLESNSTPWSHRTEKQNYIYQFDSIGRTVAVTCLNRNGGKTPFLGFCESDNQSPAKIEIAYDDEGRMSYIDHLTCYSEYGEGFLTKGGRVKIVWRKKEIKEILFFNRFRCVEKWTPNKGLVFIPIAPVLSDKNKRLLLEDLDELEQNTENQLSDFPKDSVLIYSRYKDWHWNPDTTNKYFLKKAFSSWILSDTVNSIIRYIWIQPDDLTEVFYVSNKKIIKVTRTSFGETTSLYPFSKNEYLLVENPWCLQNNIRPDIDELRIYVNKRTRVITPDDWEEKLNGLGFYNSCSLNQVIFDLKSNENSYFNNRLKTLLGTLNE